MAKRPIKRPPWLAFLALGLILAVFAGGFSAYLWHLGKPSEKFRDSAFWSVLPSRGKFQNKYAEPLAEKELQGKLALGFLLQIEFKTAESEALRLKRVVVEFAPSALSYLHVQFRRNGDDFYSYLASANAVHATGFYKFAGGRKVGAITDAIVLPADRPAVLEIDLDGKHFAGRLNGGKPILFADGAWKEGNLVLAASFPRVLLRSVRVEFEEAVTGRTVVYHDHFVPEPVAAPTFRWSGLVLGFALMGLFTLFLWSIGPEIDRAIVWSGGLLLTLAFASLMAALDVVTMSVLGLIATLFLLIIGATRGGGRNEFALSEKGCISLAAILLIITIGVIGKKALLWETLTQSAYSPQALTLAKETPLDLGRPLQGEAWNFTWEGEIFLPPAALAEFRIREEKSPREERVDAPVFILSAHPALGAGFARSEEDHLFFEDAGKTPLPSGKWLSVTWQVKSNRARAEIGGDVYQLDLKESGRPAWRLAAMTPGILVRNVVVTPIPTPPEAHRKFTFAPLGGVLFIFIVLLYGVYSGVILMDSPRKSKAGAGGGGLIGPWLALGVLAVLLWKFGLNGRMVFAWTGIVLSLFLAHFIARGRLSPRGKFILFYACLLTCGFVVEIYYYCVNPAPPAIARSGIPEPLAWYVDPMARRWNSMLQSLDFNGTTWPQEKASGTTRLMLLGSSSTVDGYGEDLASLLKKGRKSYEVVNAAVAGSVVYRQYDGLRRHLRSFSPEVIILSMGRNDTRLIFNLHDLELRKQRTVEKYTSSLMGLQRMLRHSLAYRGLVTRYRQTADSREDPDPKDEIAEKSLLLFEDDLRLLAAYCRQEGIRLLFVPEPEEILVTYKPGWLAKTRYAKMVEATARVAAEFNYPMVDSLNPFYQRRDDFLFEDDVHYTAAGKQLLAETIHARLRELGW